MQERIFRPHVIDREQVRLLVNLPPQKRVRLMLDARELAVGLIRGRLRKQYPDLTPVELNMKLIETVGKDRDP
jgi:hypothetical protein